MPQRFFPSAREGRVASRNNLLIFREIRDIEEAVLLAQIDGDFEVRISNTTMTYCPTVGPHCHTTILTCQPLITYPSIDYWRVWKGFLVNRMLEEQMKTVIRYFVDLDYSIVRKTNVNTNQTFDWVIKW